MMKLNEYWRSFNYVYILLYPPDKEQTVKDILGPHWDVDYNRQHALEVAQADAEQNPEDAYAWFNVGTNLVYFERYREAAQAYDRARRTGSAAALSALPVWAVLRLLPHPAYGRSKIAH